MVVAVAVICTKNICTVKRLATKHCTAMKKEGVSKQIQFTLVAMQQI